MSPTPTLRFDSVALARLCQRYGIRKLAVFGSVLRGEDRLGSDLDVLVEFRPDSVPGLGFITLQNDLSALFRRPVDLVTPAFISPHFRDRVLLEASPLYEAA